MQHLDSRRWVVVGNNPTIHNKYTPGVCSQLMLSCTLTQQHCTRSRHNRVCTFSTPQVVSLSFCFFPSTFSSSNSLTLLSLHSPPPPPPTALSQLSPSFAQHVLLPSALHLDLHFKPSTDAPGFDTPEALSPPLAPLPAALSQISPSFAQQVLLPSALHLDPHFNLQPIILAPF